MIASDRSRLLTAVVIAVVLHVGAAGVITVFGVAFEPYPESEPVYVTLPDYEDPEPEPVEPEPEPIAEAPAPVEPPPVQPATPEPSPVRQQSAPPSPAPSTAQPSTQAPRESVPTSPEPLPWQDQGTTAEREGARTSDSALFGFAEQDQTQSDLPSWVLAGEVVQPEESLSASDQATLDAKRQTLAGFEDRLSALVRALDSPAGPSSSPSPSQSGTSSATRDDLPGDGDGLIEWIGSGSREAVTTALPQLTSSDFGGQVPARVNYIIVFEVNAAGMVVPASLILRQSSGYTLADQKVRRAVLGWRFEPVANAATVTAIATLQITRDEIR